MGDPGNPTDEGTEPDPDQPGWASPAPPPPPSDATPSPPPAPGPPPTAPQPTTPGWGTPPPSAPAPPGGAATWARAPGPPPKKRRLTWLWLLIPLMAVLVASTVVVAIFAIRLFTEPIDSTNDFYAELQAGRYPSAYAKLCDPAKRAISESTFVQQQEQTANQRGRITDYDFNDVELGDDDVFNSSSIDATVKGTITRDGATYDVTVGLQHDDGDWKVCASTNR